MDQKQLQNEKDMAKTVKTGSTLRNFYKGILDKREPLEVTFAHKFFPNRPR
jgi:hypothetical protein